MDELELEEVAVLTGRRKGGREVFGSAAEALRELRRRQARGKM